jgi:hypothetical protein
VETGENEENMYRPGIEWRTNETQVSQGSYSQSKILGEASLNEVLVDGGDCNDNCEISIQLGLS